MKKKRGKHWNKKFQVQVKVKRKKLRNKKAGKFPKIEQFMKIFDRPLPKSEDSSQAGGRGE